MQICWQKQGHFSSMNVPVNQTHLQVICMRLYFSPPTNATIIRSFLSTHWHVENAVYLLVTYICLVAYIGIYNALLVYEIHYRTLQDLLEMAENVSIWCFGLVFMLSRPSNFTEHCDFTLSFCSWFELFSPSNGSPFFCPCSWSHGFFVTSVSSSFGAELTFWSDLFIKLFSTSALEVCWLLWLTRTGRAPSSDFCRDSWLWRAICIGWELRIDSLRLSSPPFTVS